MKYSGWYKALVSVVAPLLLLGGGIAFILLPRVLAGRGTLDEERRRFFGVAEEIRGLASLRQTLSQVSFGDLQALFIPKDRPLAFVEALETLALQTGTTMEIVFLDSSSLRSSAAPQKQKPAAADNPRDDADTRSETESASKGKGGVTNDASATKKAPAAPKQSAFVERAFEVRLRGSFQGMMRFLAALERQPALLRVDGVTIQALEERGQTLPRITTAIRFYAPTLE